MFERRRPFADKLFFYHDLGAEKDLRKIASKISDDTKAAGVKKIHLRAAQSFPGLSKQNILGITNNGRKVSKVQYQVFEQSCTKASQGRKCLLTVAN